MKVVVATLGSLGDLHPFLAVARALREQGADVLFLSQEPHRTEVQTQGLAFEAIATTHDHLRAMQHPALWHPVRGFGVLWRHLVVPAIEPTVKVLERLTAEHPSDLRVFASPLVLGARLASEVLPFRLTTGHTAPTGLRTIQDPMYIGAQLIPWWMPSLARRRLWELLDWFKLEPMATPAINSWRRAHGLPPLERPVFERWLHSPHQVLALFPPNFGPMPTDWPVPVQFTGFPLYDSNDSGVDEDPELDAFCRQPSSTKPLILFYPGSSAHGQVTQIRDAAVRFAKCGHYRCLLLEGALNEHEATPSDSAPSLLVRKRVRLSTVLPYSSIFVHHGGIGAVAQGLASNVRQVIQPAAFDQFENAWRLRKLTSPAIIEVKRDLINRISTSLKINGDLKTPMIDAKYSLPGSPNSAVQETVRLLTN